MTEPMAKVEVERLMRDCDQNRDGVLDKNEFRNAMQSSNIKQYNAWWHRILQQLPGFGRYNNSGLQQRVGYQGGNPSMGGGFYPGSAQFGGGAVGVGGAYNGRF